MSNNSVLNALKGRACELQGKHDKQDFLHLVHCLETIGLRADQLATVWAIMSSILQLGNICFSSYEVWMPGLPLLKTVLAFRTLKNVYALSCVCLYPHKIRMNPLRLPVFLVKPKLGEWETSCRCLPRPYRQSSHTG